MDDTELTGEGGGGWFLNHLPRILWERRILIITISLLALVASVVVAYSLPTVYRSKATLLVQSQDLPTNIVEAPTAGSVQQRIAKIRERVLSRGDLIALIEQDDLYGKERRSKPLSYVLDKMRKATTVSGLAGDIGSPSSGSDNTIAITMSFDYPEPAKAQSVLQSYVTNFLKIDSDEAESQANLSVRFLQDQASKLQLQIAQVEQNLTGIKARNGSALASSGAMPMIDTGSYSAQISELQNQNRQLLATGRKSVRDPQVGAAEEALAVARARYSDSHPDVIAAQERLRLLRQIAASQPADNSDASVAEQIRANNAAIAQLQQGRDTMMAKAQAASAGSARAPAILEQAMQLENRASALRGQYNDVANNLLKAQNAARMVNEQRAERLSLVDAPDMPDRPFSPNRLLIIAAGLAGGIVAGLGLALLLELIRRPLRSPSQLEAAGLPVLGVVPLLTPHAQRPSRWSRLLPRRRRVAAA